MPFTDLLARLHAIRDHNAWAPLHSPKNLAMAASVEMAELLEVFQWLSEAQSRQLDETQRRQAGAEVADVIFYLLLLSSELGLDLPQVLQDKLADNERRFLGAPAHA